MPVGVTIGDKTLAGHFAFSEEPCPTVVIVSYDYTLPPEHATRPCSKFYPRGATKSTAVGHAAHICASLVPKWVRVFEHPGGVEYVGRNSFRGLEDRATLRPFLCPATLFLHN